MGSEVMGGENFDADGVEPSLDAAPSLDVKLNLDAMARELLLSSLAGEIYDNLEAMAQTEEGRERIRSFCLDEEGVFVLDSEHPLYEKVTIHHLYVDEVLRVGGAFVKYLDGGEGLAYYLLADHERRMRLRTGMTVEVVGKNVPNSYIDRIQDSPVVGPLLEDYRNSDVLGRTLLKKSRYTGEDLSYEETYDVLKILEDKGFLGRLEDRRHWDNGIAAIAFRETEDSPQTLILMFKDSSGQIYRMRKYLISMGKYGIGDGRGATPLGVARLEFRYGGYNNKEDYEQFEVGTMYDDQIIVGRMRHFNQGKALMTTRILKINNLEGARRRPVYVHGTNHENLLGQARSIGCVRMSNIDVLELYHLTPEEGMLMDVRSEKPPAELVEILRRD